MSKFLLVLVLAAVLMAPLIMFKVPWALRLWQKLRLLLVIYVLVIIGSAIVRLALNWHSIYG